MPNKNLSNFTKEQSDILETTYEVMHDEIRKALSLVNITREGLINTWRI